MTIYFCPACQNEAESHEPSCRVCGYEFRGEWEGEPERERYDDDGRDYADPGDFLRGYED